MMEYCPIASSLFRNGVWRRLFALSSFPPARSLRPAVRGIIVPQQLKAYGGTFSQSIGERSDHLVSDVVLQSLSPSRAARSPLLSRPVKTQTVPSFSDMHICAELRAALAAMSVVTPSPIQQTAMEIILQRKDTVVAAPHGEGKTLAFLVPLYQNMVKDRDVYRIALRERRPRMIVLAPTRELVAQLQSVCAKLDAATGLRSAAFTSRHRAKFHLSRLLKDNLADVLVMDPKVLLRLIRSRRLFLDDIRYVALDEADAMLSSQHDHDAVHLLMKVQKRCMFKHLWPVETQTVFATSFITRKLEHIVGKKYPSAVTCMHRQRMHRPPSTLRHRFIPVTRESEKIDALLHVLRKHGSQPREPQSDDENRHAAPHRLSGSFDAFVERWSATCAGAEEPKDARDKNTITITNTNAVDKGDGKGDGKRDDKRDAHALAFPGADRALSARVFLEQLRPLRWEHLTALAAPFTFPIPRTVFTRERRCMLFARSIDAATALFHQLRVRGFACALLHAALPMSARRRHFADFASGRANILCATDIAARGLDVHVDFVVHVDMPTNALSYLQRAGRAARQGRGGVVYSLYTKRERVIVDAIRAFVQKGIPLEGVSNAAAHMTRPRYAEWRTHKTNAIARAFVSLVTQKTVPAHLERTYLRHNATWRPLFRPGATNTNTNTNANGGVPPRQQRRVMEAVAARAVWFRRGQLAKRKGGRAKFGSRHADRGVWNDIGGIAAVSTAHTGEREGRSGGEWGPPQGPPK